MTLVQQMLRSPRFPQYVRELEDILEAEKDRRRRFQDEVSEQQKAEFINGEVIVHSPVALEHDQVSTNLLVLAKTFATRHELGYVGHEKLLVSLTRNDYEPDVCFFGTAKSSKFRAGQMKFPAPDFVAEIISRSTEHIDRKVKFEDYAAHGVSEYWIIDPRKRTVELYVLAGDRYGSARKVKDGTIRSRAINGFVIPVRALFDAKENLRVLQGILNET
ncbi:MAG TPA: Uma2 family endonuclease [Humisphaera sp.]|jgi:Uma2 family endonuclease|nr:Uma2 family endonuclease [Humisphaera sp.]